MDLMMVSRRQIYWLLFTIQTSSMLLLSIRSTILISKQDSWMSMLIGGFIGLGITYIVVRLSLLFPMHTVVQYSQLILGKWLGKLYMLPYFAMGISALCIILRQLTDFVHLAWFERTPSWVILIGLMWLIGYVTFAGGIEGIARCAEIIGPIVMLTIMVATLLGFGSFEFGQLLPVYTDTGWQTILRGSLSSASFLGQSIVMLTLVAFMKEKDKAMASSILGVLTVSITLAISMFFILAMFGPDLGAEMLYPAYEYTRFLSILNFLQSLDALVVVVWVLGYFVQLSTYFFLISYSAGQWFGIKKWKYITFPLAVLVFVGAMLPQGYNFSSIIFPREIWIKYVMPINMIALPSFLLVIGMFRTRYLKKKTRARMHG